MSSEHTTRQLVEYGEAFVERNAAAAQALELPVYFISGTEEGRNFDGSARYNITELTRQDGSIPCSEYLDYPLFITPDDDTTPQLANNPLINASDCSPDLLISIGQNMITGNIPMPEAFRRPMIERIGAVLLNSATPNHLMADLAESVSFIPKDDAQPNTYMAAAGLFFRSLADKQILAFDVHDIAQHALQLSLYPDAFTTVARTASIAYNQSNQSQSDISACQLSAFVWGTAFEEAVIQQENALTSYGCLNWLAPGDTPTDYIPSFRELSPDEQKLAYRWHCLDAIKDLYRKQHAFGQEHGAKLDWMEQLGYDANDEFLDLCDSKDPVPFKPLAFADANRLEVSAPSTPEELMENAVALLQREKLV